MDDNKIFFMLNDDFVNKFKGKQPKWGPLGYVVFKRTYARPLPNGKTEEYWQTLRRVVEGVFTIQKRHCYKNKLPWSQKKANNSAQRMFELMWEFKFTPPGRGLWMMGTDYVFERGSAALQNCGFVSTENISTDFAEPFCFLMDMSMLGVGVGSDTKGAGKITIQQPKIDESFVYEVEDTREGWVDLLKILLNAYTGKNSLPSTINYSKIRARGEPIKGFGGTASGYEPLKKMYISINKILMKRIGNKITSSDIVDIFNLIAKCVVSGNVRRSATIIFGEPDDAEFLNLKNPKLHKKELYNHRWASNNSVFANIGMNYSEISEKTVSNGEPGYIWLENMRKYSRINCRPDNKDYRVGGGNPCQEQSLEPWELCNLVETFPVKHDSLEEWLETLKYAYMYAKTVTLIPTHNQKTNNVMNRNRRIGCSISGVVQAFKKFSRRKFFQACEEGYEKIQYWDRIYSEWLGIPRSIKTTSVKPSGSVSLLAGVTPGVHYPVAEYYIRNIRFQAGSPMLKQLKEAGYKVEKDKYSENTVVVSFPVKEEFFDRSVDQVSVWEQLENVAQLQTYWADNQVSVTAYFSPEEAKDIKNILELYEVRLKGVSFLPRKEHGYKQAPYIPLTKEQYENEINKIKKIRLKGDTHELLDKYCDGSECEVRIPFQ